MCCLELVERSGVAPWLEAEIAARYRRPGRPRELSVAALLTALLLLATDDRALHLSGATEVLFTRLSDEAKATLGVRGDVGDQRSFLARYRQVRYLFHAITCVLDPSRLAKNHRLDLEAFAQRCTTMSDDDALRARDRLESFVGAMLSARVAEWTDALPGALAYGLDATAVPLFSRGPPRPAPKSRRLGPRSDAAHERLARTRKRGVVSQSRRRSRARTTRHRPRRHGGSGVALGAFARLRCGTAGRGPRLLGCVRDEVSLAGARWVTSSSSTTASINSVARRTATARSWSRVLGTARGCPRCW